VLLVLARQQHGCAQLARHFGAKIERLTSDSRHIWRSTALRTRIAGMDTPDLRMRRQFEERISRLEKRFEERIRQLESRLDTVVGYQRERLDNHIDTHSVRV
jgi:hypothetical protein